MTQEIHICSSPAALEKLAEQLASSLKGGEIFALEGDLGLGKTTFVKGLARGLKIPGTVTSPTFNLVHRYGGGLIPLVHFDLYRLKSIVELESLDLDSTLDSNAILAIEWPRLAIPMLPPQKTLRIILEESENEGRRVTLIRPALNPAL